MSRREHIEALTGLADGVVIGSAFIDLVGARLNRRKEQRQYVNTWRCSPVVAGPDIRATAGYLAE